VIFFNENSKLEDELMRQDRNREMKRHWIEAYKRDDLPQISGVLPSSVKTNHTIF
jgi:hypothetical protein